MEERAVNDPVRKPSHYVRGGFELADVLDAWDLPRWETQAVQYIMRAKYKGTELQDLQKAREFLNRAIARLERTK